MKNFWIDKTKKKQLIGSGIMGIGLLGNSEALHAKFRFFIEFHQDSKVIVDPTCVHINAQPVSLGNLSVTYYDAPLSVMKLVTMSYDNISLDFNKLEGVTSIVTLYDGYGCPFKKWNLSGLKIIKLNFGNLDYSSQEEFTLGMDLSYEVCGYENLTVSSSWIAASLAK